MAAPLQAFAALGLIGCTSFNHPRVAAMTPGPTPQEIVIRTSFFAFHLGARADETWPEGAEDSYEALGGASRSVLEQEDVLVPVVAGQLGVVWPHEGLDFDVVYRGAGHGGCTGHMLSRIDLGRELMAPGMFFACVMNRSFARLEAESAMDRAIAAARERMGPKEQERIAGLYSCIATYAVVTVMVLRAGVPARDMEDPLRQKCTPREIDWMKGHFPRAIESQTAEAYGEQAARELGAE